MNWSEISRQLKLMEAIVDEAQHSGEMSDLERDLLLETLRKCYAAVRYSEIEVNECVQPEVVAAAAAMAEVAEEKVAEVEEEVVPEVEEKIAPEEPVVVEEELVEEEVAEVAPAEEEKPAVEEVVTTVRHKLDRQTIRSLYDDDAPASVATFELVAEVAEPEVAVAPAEEEAAPVFEITEDDADEDGEVVYMADDEEEEEIAEEETAPSIFEITDEEEYEEAEEEIEELPFSFREVEEESSEEVAPTIADAAQPVTVLGDVVGAERTTIADSITPKEDVASVIGSSQLSSLRSAIGLNDKFLLIRDLFGGDNGAYEAAIDGLDSCQSLDDAMLYIFDNFAWDSECDGAKLLTELLSRRFQ